MRRLSVTLLLSWASLALAADPAAAPAAAPTAPVAPAAGAATPPTPVSPTPAAPSAATAPAPATAPAATATPSAAAAPATRDPEATLVRELVAKNTQGRAVELTVEGRTVVALYTPQTAARARGAVLLLHDLGGHADWPGVIAPLRRNLPALGWSTLSVQLPPPDKALPAAQRKAWLDRIAPRIDAALAWLKGEGQLNVVLAGHGLGAVAALDYASSHPVAVRGLTLVSLPLLRGDDPRLFTGEALGKLKLPVLDIYGSADTEEIAATASLRREGAGHGGNYLLVELPGADHFFTAQDALLTSRVRGWLDHRLTGVELKKQDEGATDSQPTTDKNKGTQP